jgi:lipoate-protein ligase A
MLQILNSGASDPAFNMGMDEALLGFVQRLKNPVLRFYAWTAAAASFGYFQKYSEVERLTGLRPLVRRPTGGGVVPHDRDWTYTLVFPPCHPWYALRARQSYRAVHLWLQAGFSRLGAKTEVAEEAMKAGPGHCFAGHEQFDLLLQKRKIAGAAQRRTKQGLLIQGSIQFADLALGRAGWETAMAEVAPVDVATGWGTLAPDACLSNEAQRLTAVKYSRAEYNRKR